MSDAHDIDTIREAMHRMHRLATNDPREARATLKR